MINIQANQTFEAILDGAAIGLVGNLGIQVKLLGPSPSVAIARSTGSIVEVANGAYAAERTAPGTPGDYLIIWDLPDPTDLTVPPARITVTESLKVWAGPPPEAPPLTDIAFASANDVAVRRGVTFTTEQIATASMLVQAATVAILDAVGKTEAWALQQDAVPPMLRYLCIELASRAMANPDSVRSESEQLGQHQHSVSFRDTGGGITLTDTEERLARRVVYGSTSGSARPASVADDLADGWAPGLQRLIGGEYNDTSPEDGSDQWSY